MFFIHQRFEGSAEQVRVDRGFRPGAGVFAGGEAESCEGVEEEWSEVFVVDWRASCAAFLRRAGEEAAVEKRDVAKGARGGRAVASGGVEGAEREWCDEAMPEFTA